MASCWVNFGLKIWSINLNLNDNRFVSDSIIKQYIWYKIDIRQMFLENT